ncbi:MAG: homoserine kinase [Dehalococcoidia bacterium]|nr:homoserine kinase [Dehalococcoidia bacterium]
MTASREIKEPGRGRIRVQVPATTANLGPGFDCLGMALDIWNQVEVELSSAPLVRVDGKGGTDLPSGPQNLVYRSIVHLLEHVGVEPPPLSVACTNNIPLKRGLGSSAAAIVGGLTAGNRLVPILSGGRVQSLSPEEVLQLAVAIEGHPDNVAPALMGGMVLVVQGNDGLLTSAVPVPEDLRAVLYIPDLTIATEDARSVLPEGIAWEDAVFNMGRTALLVNAMNTGRLEDLSTATEDKLHQPYRRQLFPAMKVIFEGAMKGGALGVFLSGSGPTILALRHGREVTVAYEMAEAARQASVPGEVKVTRPVSTGTICSWHEEAGAG